MRITTQGEYGLRILIRLARANDDTPRSVNSIAEAEDLSRDYVEQLLLRLRRAGLVRSTRGVKGGYHLATAARRIRLYDVLHVLEDAVFDVPCERMDCVTARADCKLAAFWERFETLIGKELKHVTIADLA